MTPRTNRSSGEHSVLPRWLSGPAGAEARLRAGARVAGIGTPQTLLALARSFPRSTFHGFDDRAATVANVRTAVALDGLADRVTYEVVAHGRLRGGNYDLICTRGVLGEAEPADVGRTVQFLREALATGGWWLSIEP